MAGWYPCMHWDSNIGSGVVIMDLFKIECKRCEKKKISHIVHVTVYGSGRVEYECSVCGSMEAM